MTLINLTPHDITIFAKEGTIVLPGSDKPARLEENTVYGWCVQHDGIEVKLPIVSYGQVFNIPDPDRTKQLIVSQMVAQALPDRLDLFYPYDMVRDNKGVILGCRSLAQWRAS